MTAHDAYLADYLRPAVNQRKLIIAFCALAELNPTDRECWYDKKVLGIGDARQGASLGVSKARVWTRVDNAQKRIDRYVEQVAA